jgi:hypothetical protein
MWWEYNERKLLARNVEELDFVDEIGLVGMRDTEQKLVL